MMAQVPEYKEFQALVERVEKLERENEELRSKFVVREWLSREETMKLLSVSDSTLWRLTRSNTLSFRYQGNRPFYELSGLKTYLTAQKISPVAVDQRIERLCKTVI